ncbi:phenylacrylic acid decarboxylase [Metarhizium acridum]|uniref:phenylacrylic acid decarboxylase n=1 Tax=Metarhizium acridum TaxID=92637 RepID=UPI001C6C0483|nr:phenylacrylic acid decarboxylase [Metarhizium acridum]KAG8423054.1 phenylacrylic acid decarboxylase [Metarhizium acridum]
MATSQSGSNGHAPPTGALLPHRRRKKIIVAMTGATGAILGIKTLLALRQLNVETHLITSKWADSTLKYETDYTTQAVRALADHVHSNHDMSAPVASGSYRVDGMIIIPCSMKTLAAISSGYCDDLISRAADVMLKERKRLVLATRECPLSGIHIKNMATVTQNGGIIFPPVPAFYTRPSCIDDIVAHTVGRILDLFDLDSEEFERWQGFQKK